MFIGLGEGIGKTLEEIKKDGFTFRGDYGLDSEIYGKDDVRYLVGNNGNVFFRYDTTQ